MNAGTNGQEEHSACFKIDILIFNWLQEKFPWYIMKHAYMYAWYKYERKFVTWIKILYAGYQILR